MIVLIWDNPQWRNVRAAEVAPQVRSHWGVKVRDRGAIVQIGEYHFPNPETYLRARAEGLRQTRVIYGLEAETM